MADWGAGRGPLYRRLADSIRGGIERGEIPAGTLLPPERTLCLGLRIGRNTVAAAYETLRREGLVERRQGRGTIVRSELAVPASTRAAELSTSLRLGVALRGLTESPEDTIDFLSAHAPTSAGVREVMTDALASLDMGRMERHHGYYPLGYPPLRRAVAHHLTALGLPSEEQDILITSGAQQAISLVAACFIEPGQFAVLEDPTFPGAIDAFLASGARLLTVPVGQDGIDVDVLASTLRASVVRAVYVMPTFHNPTGTVMPEDARRRLAALAAATEVPIIEDNTLAELSLSGDPAPAIAAFSRKAPLLSIGSMSKLYWGGLRVGWIRGSRSMITHLGRLKAAADLGTSTLSQAVAFGLLQRVDDVKELRRQEISERLALLSNLLQDHLPDWRWRSPAGGLCVWARLSAGNSRDFVRHASHHGVAIVPGSVMSARSAFDDYVRLPMSPGHEEMSNGVTRLASAWNEYVTELGHGGRRLDVVV